MYCTSCGAKIGRGVESCPSCGATQSPAGAVAPQQAVSNYLTHAIVLTLCCCWPLAIPAIYAAAKVNYHLGAGQLTEALEASKKAKQWCWAAFGTGLAIWLLYFITMIVVGAVDELG